MKCNACDSPKSVTVYDPAAEGIIARETEATKVVGVGGKVYSLNQPLVPPLHFPRGQWAANVRIKGIVRRLDYPQAVAVFNEAMRLFQLNGEPFRFTNIWLNLNLQWIPKVAEQYQIVTVAQLEAISDPI